MTRTKLWTTWPLGPRVNSPAGQDTRQVRDISNTCRDHVTIVFSVSFLEFTKYSLVNRHISHQLGGTRVPNPLSEEKSQRDQENSKSLFKICVQTGGAKFPRRACQKPAPFKIRSAIRSEGGSQKARQTAPATSFQTCRQGLGAAFNCCIRAISSSAMSLTFRFHMLASTISTTTGLNESVKFYAWIEFGPRIVVQSHENNPVRKVAPT